EGFYHLISFEGTVEKVVMRYIIRDFEYTSLQNRMQLMTSCIEKINQCYGKKIADIFIEDQYQNMKEIIDRNFHIIDNAKLAMMHSDVRPQIKPIRGGTDGARLSFMGLPCPNIFTGGHNFHSRYEFIPIQSMEKCVNVILELGKI
ncbi:MAG: peptidase T, partial [Paludibacteraceae bacterium]|nr:peptidase T [Paludibacteraceae bacterium]